MQDMQADMRISNEPRPTIPWPDVIDMIETISEEPHASLRDHYWEIFCPQRVGPLVRERGYRSSKSIDLKTGWDLNDDNVQRQLFIDLVRERPYFVLLSPPCTYFSNLMFSNWSRMGAEKYGHVHLAVRQLDFCMLIADFQVWWLVRVRASGNGSVLEPCHGLSPRLLEEIPGKEPAHTCIEQLT